LLHNVSYLQENLFCSESKVLGLCGDQADVYRVDSKSATGSLELSLPAWRDLKSLQMGSYLDSLVVPDQNPSMARFKNSMWIPPLVSVAILEADSLIPSVLIPMLSSKFQEFDRSSTSTKARTILHPVVEFLWAVHKKLVPPTTLAVENSSDAIEWSARLHFAYIQVAPMLVPPPPFPVPPVPGVSAIASSPFRHMTDKLQKIREANECQLLNEAQAVDAKKRYKRLGQAP
jgi:hypothetical protein